MSWSEATAKPLKILVVLSLLMLAACSGFRPLYGDSAVPPGRYSYHYAEPNSRLEQIIYTELRLRLGPDSTDPGALTVTVSASAGARALTRTATAKPATTDAMTVYIAVSVISPKGEVVFSGNRTSNALYDITGQVLADVEAQNEAAERGARALADSIRLDILGALARQK